MLKFIVLTSALLLPVAAQATPLTAEETANATRIALSKCNQQFPAQPQTFCSCYASTLVSKTTQEDFAHVLKFRAAPPDYDMRAVNPTIDACVITNK
jgi:hypothetical protein